MRLIVLGLFLCSPAFSAVSYSVTSVSANYSVQASDQYVNMTVPSITMSLPPCGSGNNGDTYIFKADFVSVNTSQVLPNGSDTIDGAGGLVLAADQSATLLCLGGSNDWKGIGVY